MSDDAAVDVVLRDGATVGVRMAGPDDERKVAAFLERLSPDALHDRFGAGIDPAWAAQRTVGASEGQFALLATTGPDDAVVGVAELWPAGDGRGEIAFAVADAMQGRGLATILLAHLAEAAARRGIATLQAQVAAGNRRMVEVFRDSGLRFRSHLEDGTLLFEAPAALTPDALERFEERDSIATANAVARVLRPASIAVVGASRRADAVGARVLAKILEGGYTGTVHPVNPRASQVEGLPASPTVEAIGTPVDLVIVAVPAPAVLEVARDAARAQARSLLVLSAGFAEAGPEGAERQRELLAICRTAGMRLVGPNCLGVINTDDAVRLDATFGAARPRPGRVGMMSQSGAVGIVLLERAAELGIGVSTFVSAGNKADLSGNDFLRYWEHDDATGVVLLYLESFGNPRNFARIARRLTRSKPIVALKSGRTPVGARAAGSHTGALLAASDLTVDALFRQAGVIRADTVAEFLDVAALLERQPPPRGDRVAIVTNAGGPAIMCADACVAAGLAVPEPPQEAVDELRALLPGPAATGNPIDMLASADPDLYARTVATVARGGWADAVVAIYVRVADRAPAEYQSAVEEAIAAVPDAPPLLWVQMSGTRDAGRRSPLPTYAYPEDAARALAHAVEYGRRRGERPPPVTAPPGARPGDAAVLLAAEAGEEPRWLDGERIAALCEAWGIPLVSTRSARDAEEAAAVAERLGGPVALKAVAPGLVHKTDAGGVALGLAGAAEVREAAEAMAARLRDAGFAVEGFLVQPMVEAGVEMLVGVTHDPSFGPVVVCGAGGVRAELERDVAARLVPLTRDEALEALRSLRTFPLLEGWRGAPPCDVDALADVLIRTAAMADAHPEILELDFNPVAVSQRGAVVLDARVRVARPAPQPPWPSVGATPPHPAAPEMAGP